MAFKKIELTEEEMKSGSGRQWKKFVAIGDSAVGFFVRKETATANYNDGPKEITKWIFYGKLTGRPSPEDFEITPPSDLKQRLEKAEKEEGLLPGAGHLVKMTFAKSRVVEGQTDPKKIFEVAVELEFKPQNPLPASVVWAKTAKGSSSGSGSGDEDIPF